VSHSRIVILSGRSLFAEGLTARLSRQPGRHELLSVDARQDDALDRVIGLRPETVLLDSSDETVMRHRPLNHLLAALPELRIVRLDPQTDQVQIVTSQRHAAGQIDDLLALIDSTAEPGGQPPTGGPQGG
jgi:hypothetical protein